MRPDERLADELAHSASALRALARDLTGSAEADDLVQETMLRAWRKPPRERSGLGPWLATILRNTARNRQRDERRRRERERQYDARRTASDDDRPPEPETLRAVTEMLWQLPEPYQATLTLRYFTGLTPSAIAARTGAPLPTVKSRLRRGLQLLRERLERERGSDWRTALCAATGLPTAGAVAATATTIPLLLMAHTTKILFGTAALVVATMLLWQPGDPALAPTDDRGPRRSAATGGDLATHADPTRIERIAAGSDAANDEADLDHPFAFELRCRVVDRDGLIVPNARIAIAPLAADLNQWVEPTGEDGEVTIAWRARVPTMSVQVGLMVINSAEGLRTIQVESGGDNRIALLHAFGASANFCEAARQSASTSCTACHMTGTGGSKLFDAMLTTDSGMHPHARFQGRLLGADRPSGDTPPPPPPPPPPPQYVAINDYVVEEAEARNRPRPPVTTIAGVVRDARGEPVGNATVIWSQRADLPLGRSRTDGSGAFTLTHVSPGEVEVRAGGGADGIARQTVRIAPGNTTTVELFLAAGRALQGRVRLPGAAAADGWRVEYVARDACWSDGVVIQGSTFRLANLPSREGEALLWSPHGRLPVAHVPHVFADAGVTFDLTMPGLPAGELRLELPDAGSEEVGAVVYHVATGRGAAMTRAGTSFSLQHLAAGWYRVHLIGPRIGCVDLGQHFVDGTAPTDLGSQGLPTAATLRIDRRSDGPRFEIYQRRRELDVRAWPADRGQLEFRLPPGEWLVIWGDEGVRRTRSITAGADPVTVRVR